MKIDHVKNGRNMVVIWRGLELNRAGTPPLIVKEMIHHNDAADAIYLYAKDATRLGVYYIAPGDLVVYASAQGLPEDDHGE